MQSNSNIDFTTFISILWRGKWTIAAFAGIFLLLSITYAIFATEWYRASVLLVPADQKVDQGIAAQLGGLAGLAGLDVDSGRDVESLAVLKSREFARDFIQEMDLLPVFWADIWDSASKRWRVSNPDDVPDLRDAVQLFDEDLRIVEKDLQTGLVELSIEWTDPDLAALWANTMVNKLNQRMRAKALSEAEANVEYLRTELAQTKLVPIQQSVGRLLETELQKLMLARGSQEYSFKVIDPARPPKYAIRPKKILIILVGLLGGIAIGIFYLLIRAEKNS